MEIAYTPCWPAAASLFGPAASLLFLFLFQFPFPFHSVCLSAHTIRVRLSALPLYAYLSVPFASLSPSTLPLLHSLCVCVCCVVPRHTPCSAKSFPHFRKYFPRHFALFFLVLFWISFWFSFQIYFFLYFLCLLYWLRGFCFLASLRFCFPLSAQRFSKHNTLQSLATNWASPC